MADITFCPNCGKRFSDFSVGIRRESAIDWTGKVHCPSCNFFGFFLKISDKDYARMKFKPKEFPKRPAPSSSFEPGPDYWLVGLIAICLLLGLLYVLLRSI